MCDDIMSAVARFNAINDGVGIASLVLDEEGNIRNVNAHAVDLFGVPEEHMLNRTISSFLVHGADAIDEFLSHDERCEQQAFLDMALPGAYGGERLVAAVPQIFRSADGAGRLVLLPLIEKNKADHVTEIRLRYGRDRTHLPHRLLATHQAEMKRVSSQLYDGIGQALATIKYMVEDASRHMQRGQYAEGDGILDETVQCVRAAINEIRRISHEMHPSSLDDLGLIPTLVEHCRNFRNAYPRIVLTLDFSVDEWDIPERMKSEIFRIAQDSMNSIAMDCSATMASVALRTNPTHLVLTVLDNGGRPQSPASCQGARQGLKPDFPGMRDRVEATGGRIVINTSRAGTLIEARWCLQGAAQAVKDKSCTRGSGAGSCHHGAV